MANAACHMNRSPEQETNPVHNNMTTLLVNNIERRNINDIILVDEKNRARNIKKFANCMNI